MRHIHLDPLGGTAGDMFAAAMLHAFPELYPVLCDDLKAAGLLEYVVMEVREVRVNGISAKEFHVRRHPAAQKRATGTYAGIRGMLSASHLSRPVLDCCLAIFDLLAEAEGRVHGVAPEAVHFHELADWDSLADITAAASLITHSAASSWSVAALPPGSGTVATSHGLMPVPAPATLELLKGFRLRPDDGIGGERVTPTGAAILRCLSGGKSSGIPAGVLTHSGAGAGQKRFTEARLPNILRLLALDLADESHHTGQAEAFGRDRIAQLSFEIDDMTPELLAIGLEKLRNCAGVRDVSYGIRHGKKGRSQFAVRVLAEPDYTESVARQCLLETSTIGLRVSSCERIVLERREHPGTNGKPSAKQTQRPDGRTTTKAEANDLAAIEGHGVRERAAAQVLLHSPTVENYERQPS